MWSECYITCDSTKLSIKKKPNKKIVYEFVFTKTKLSKVIR